MSEHYDKNGKEISLWVWAKLIEDRDYKVIRQEFLPSGRWVSTVWLGLDHNFGSMGPPLIFETMVFEAPPSKETLEMDRYSTEAEAIEGHITLLEKWWAEEETVRVTTRIITTEEEE